MFFDTHLNLFSSKSLHPDLNTKLGLNEKTSVIFFFFFTAETAK